MESQRLGRVVSVFRGGPRDLVGPTDVNETSLRFPVVPRPRTKKIAYDFHKISTVRAIER